MKQGMRHHPKKKDNIYRILIVEPNWLGDVMFTTPAIRAVRKAFPDAYISCWSVPRVADILRCNPHVDEVIVYDERKWYQAVGSAMRFVADLTNRCFDLGILFHRSFTRALILRLAGVAEIVGQASPKRKWLGISHLVELDYNGMHRVEFYLRIIQSVGIEADGYDYDFQLQEEDIKYVRSMLDFWKVRDNFIVLVPGANWERKRWPEENFVQLCDRIIGELGMDVVLVGSARDLFLCESIAEKARYGERVFVSAGKTTIPQLASLLSLARAVVSNDTGPLHIGSAVNKNVLGIFGPTSPEITGLYGDLAKNNLSGQVKCMIPCYLKECIDDLSCIKSVTVDMVFDRLVRVCER